MRRVVDATVAVKWIVAEDGSDRATALLSEASALYSPHLVAIETVATLTKKLRRKLVSASFVRNGARFIDSHIRGGQLLLHPDAALLAPATDLSIELGHPLYDCLYLSLAIIVDAPLVTADRQFQQKIAATKLGRHILLL